jgi:hypothetical protein
MSYVFEKVIYKCSRHLKHYELHFKKCSKIMQMK